MHQVDALTRILEADKIDGVIIFVKTKAETVNLADELVKRGFSALAISGDLNQKQRESSIEKIKDSTTQIMVATDVAARGLDVERISHVINYDAPGDPE